MLESFLYAGTRLDLPVRAIAITRSRQRFAAALPHLANDPRVETVESDAASMPIPAGPVDFIIHSLVPASGIPLPETDAIFQASTKRLLEIALNKQAQAFLLCSTGAVYQPKLPLAPFSEEDPLVPPDGPLSYGQVRRRLEDQCQSALANSAVALKIARGFAFVGPRLPLDGSFAIGNFLRDALAGRPITVQGDGSPVRSYMYAADLAAWLWTILVEGQPGRAYNVGSEEATTIGDLARRIGRMLDVPVLIAGKPLAGAAPNFYVPCTKRAQGELGVALRAHLDVAIQSMASCHSMRQTENTPNEFQIPGA
jgi:dTDP-glucose 4,6-dehydratase